MSEIFNKQRFFTCKTNAVSAESEPREVATFCVGVGSLCSGIYECCCDIAPLQVTLCGLVPFLIYDNSFPSHKTNKNCFL